MKDKTQYEALMEELQKIVENFRVGVTEIGEKFAKLLPDIEIYEEEEEDKWEMKCPYKKGDKYWFCYDDFINDDCWGDLSNDNERFRNGNTFTTKKAAELEAKRRNLLTRFRAFRDECNNGWKADWGNFDEYKYYIICEKCTWVKCSSTCFFEEFVMFGYFRNHLDCERAIELFGDEIKELFVEGEV